ncbi:MAG: ABC transporter ATP-binding protein [Acidimicrobiales bacterium]
MTALTTPTAQVKKGRTPTAATPFGAIELRNASKHYPGNPPVRALDDVTVRIDHGELVAVVGPSGSGKSTMLTVMGTLDQPTAGTVLVDGIDTTTLDDNRLAGLRARRIGFVFQQFFLLPGMSTVDNVANGLLYQGVKLAERRDRAVAALERVGLGHRLGHRPNQLSGGEQQRVAVARALVHDPAFVLADEPTGNLDSRSTAAVVDLLEGLHAEGTTIVVITHDLDLAQRFPRQLSILDGRLQADTRQERTR